MAISNVNGVIETYNYDSFTKSESAAKSNEFKNALPAGDEAPDFELSTIDASVFPCRCSGAKNTCC